MRGRVIVKNVCVETGREVLTDTSASTAEKRPATRRAIPMRRGDVLFASRQRMSEAGSLFLIDFVRDVVVARAVRARADQQTDLELSLARVIELDSAPVL